MSRSIPVLCAAVLCNFR